MQCAAVTAPPRLAPLIVQQLCLLNLVRGKSLLALLRSRRRYGQAVAVARAARLRMVAMAVEAGLMHLRRWPLTQPTYLPMWLGKEEGVVSTAKTPILLTPVLFLRRRGGVARPAREGDAANCVGDIVFSGGNGGDGGAGNGGGGAGGGAGTLQDGVSGTDGTPVAAGNGGAVSADGGGAGGDGSVGSIGSDGSTKGGAGGGGGLSVGGTEGGLGERGEIRITYTLP